MKQLLAAIVIALSGIGSASADIYADEVKGISGSSGHSSDLTNLPATSAGPNKLEDSYLFPTADHG